VIGYHNVKTSVAKGRLGEKFAAVLFALSAFIFFGADLTFFPHPALQKHRVGMTLILSPTIHALLLA
jgi:hypothetical protein